MEIDSLRQMVADCVKPNKPGSQGDLWSKMRRALEKSAIPGATDEDRKRSNEAVEAFEKRLFMTYDQLKDNG